MFKIKKTILVTCAFPYANGPIHLGHLLEHVQADIFVRYHKMKNNKVYFFSAIDAHGTAIMLKANVLKISPEKLVEKTQKEHKKDFENFNINYNYYGNTHSDDNQKISEKIFLKLKKNGYIKKKDIFQLYDPKKKIFLPDRFVKGICPKCKASDQYGDVCEICYSIYNAQELINPYSIITGNTPKIKKTTHLFFNLPFFKDFLFNWMKSKDIIQKNVLNKVLEWFENGLELWDITRDAPYFGFKIPNETNKYFYVWLDASIGYISISKILSKKYLNLNYKKFWNRESKIDLCHFIGKDIIYFHSLFWPAILESIHYRQPTKIFVHGNVIINGYKMSKSRGTFITARSYINYLEPDYLRYYYASKLSLDISDIDLNLRDFMQRINSDLINKILNFASRNAKIIDQYFHNKLSSKLEDPIFYQKFVKKREKIEFFFENLEYSKVINEVILLIKNANYYFNLKAPWNLLKEKNHMHNICTTGINLYRVIMTYLKPIIPNISKNAENFLNISLKWDEINHPLLNHDILSFKILFTRIDYSSIESILKKNK
ncbi:MAG: methionine--tRNA ligase [Arsenophonus sp.]|nr:MAG: methionine--tRNA ligase [Arsenophonus sp.]